MRKISSLIIVVILFALSSSLSAQQIQCEGLKTYPTNAGGLIGICTDQIAWVMSPVTGMTYLSDPDSVLNNEIAPVISANGKVFVLAYSYPTEQRRVYDIDGNRLHVFFANGNEPVALSTDGMTLVSAQYYFYYGSDRAHEQIKWNELPSELNVDDPVAVAVSDTHVAVSAQHVSDDNYGIWLRELDSGEPGVEIWTDRSPSYAMTFSPDGQILSFLSLEGACDGNIRVESRLISDPLEEYQLVSDPLEGYGLFQQDKDMPFCEFGETTLGYDEAGEYFFVKHQLAIIVWKPGVQDPVFSDINEEPFIGAAIRYGENLVVTYSSNVLWTVPLDEQKK